MANRRDTDTSGVGMAASTRMGSYEIFECLGRGGMAEVYRAQIETGPGVWESRALKYLLPELADSPSLVRSFIDEAKLAKELVHPNIPRTYELGRHDGSWFITMELVEGPTLLEVIALSVFNELQVPTAIAIQILIQVCDALDYAHTLTDDRGQPRGIVHRDVSPANVVLSKTGAVKLIDFGIAKARSRLQTETETRTVKGKLGYLAPEYVGGSLDARADLFGLGVIAHELLTHRRLFRGATDFETLENVCRMPILPPSHWNAEVPSDLDEVVMTALSRDPDQRWQTAAALRTALTAIARDLGISSGERQIANWVVVWEFARQSYRADTEVDNGPDLESRPELDPIPELAQSLHVEPLPEVEPSTAIRRPSLIDLELNGPSPVHYVEREPSTAIRPPALIDLEISASNCAPYAEREPSTAIRPPSPIDLEISASNGAPYAECEPRTAIRPPSPLDLELSAALEVDPYEFVLSDADTAAGR
ncbi:MAG: serine/threonine-protein kinase [Kofleriaceae bacterium]